MQRVVRRVSHEATGRSAGRNLTYYSEWIGRHWRTPPSVASSISRTREASAHHSSLIGRQVFPPGTPRALQIQPVHLPDMMATAVDLCRSASYPREFGGKRHRADAGQKPPSGPPGKAARPDGKPIFREHEGNKAVLDGKWKLVAGTDSPGSFSTLEADRTEQHDLVEQQPELAASSRPHRNA